MIGPAGTIDKIGCQTLIDDLTVEQVAFLAEFIRLLKSAQKVRVKMSFEDRFGCEMEFEI